jgi:hypothetical protein
MRDEPTPATLTNTRSHTSHTSSHTSPQHHRSRCKGWAIETDDESIPSPPPKQTKKEFLKLVLTAPAPVLTRTGHLHLCKKRPLRVRRKKRNATFGRMIATLHLRDLLLLHHPKHLCHQAPTHVWRGTYHTWVGPFGVKTSRAI